MAQTVCILPPNQQEVRTATDELISQLSQSAIPYSFTRGLAGTIVGNVIDKTIDPYDENGIPLFTALGMLAGTRTAIRGTGYVGRTARKVIDPVIPSKVKEWMELDGLKRTQDYLDSYGMTVNASDAEAVGGFRSSMNAVSGGLLAGRGAVDSMMKSSWVSSQFSTLRRIAKDAPVAHKMIKFMQDIPNQIKQLKGDIQMEYNAKHGTDAYEKFLSTRGLEIVKPILNDIVAKAGGTPVTDRIAKKELTESIYRILDSGLGGVNPQTNKPALNEFYADKQWAKALDEGLVANAEIKEFIDNTRNFHSRVANEFETQAYRLINNKVDELSVLLKDGSDSSVHLDLYRENLENVVTDFRTSGLSWKAYVDSLEAKDYNNLAATLQALRSENAKTSRTVQLFNQIRELQTKINHMKSMDQAYIPHVEDRRKMKGLKERLIRSKEIRADGESADIGLENFEEYVQRRIFEVNYGNDRKLYAEDESLMDFTVKHYRSEKEAKDGVRLMLTEKRSRGEISPEHYELAIRKLDSMVKKGVRTSTDKGVEVTKPIFYLEAIEDLPTLFQKNNRSAFDVFSSQYRAKNFDVKKSSRLDYQRKLDIPMEFRQTDIYQLNNSYANDVAPRLHSMRNGIYDITDFEQQWVLPLQTQLGAKEGSVDAMKIAERIKGIYNTTLRINHFENPGDLARYEAASRFANGWRNTMAMAYQYGIGFYNLFEHAVQTPTLTSWGSYGKTMYNFALNRKQANAMADYVLDSKVMDMQLKGHSGNLDLVDEVAGSTWGERALESGANLSANFSFTKYLGKGLNFASDKIGAPQIFNVERAGLGRIFLDGFMGGNLMSTAINAHSSLYEVRKLSQVYQALRNIPEGQPQIVQMHGRRYNIGEVERRLANLGIDESRLRGFMDSKTQDFLGNFMETIKAGHRFTTDELRDNKEAFGYINTILNTTTENYQATNQFYRPEKAMTPGGRIAAQYSTYSYNQVFQNLQRRIRFPIEDWRRTLPDDLAQTNAMTLLYHYNTGNFEALRNIGFTNKMIETFPADAYNHIVKYFGGAVGLSVIGHLSVDAFRDLVANPFKEDTDDHWRRVNRRQIVNMRDPKSEQYTFGDLLDRRVDPQIFHLAQYVAAVTIDTGLTGRLDMLYSSFGKQSLLDLTPVSRATNDIAQDVWRVMAGGPKELSETMTDVAVRNALRYLPIVGSSPLSEARGTIQKKLLDNPNAPTIRANGGPILSQSILSR